MSAAKTTERMQLNMTVARPAEQIAARVKELTASDPQFRAALPLPAVNEAKLRPELGLAQIAALVMEAYADRPALAQRATELVTDPATGRTTRQQLKRFETVSYRELWSRARALANVWHHDAARPLRANDFLCILAFAGIDFATVDLAAIHNGAVVVPLQTNAAMQQLLSIIKEVEPKLAGDQPRIAGHGGRTGAHRSSSRRPARVRLSPRGRQPSGKPSRPLRRSLPRRACPICWSRCQQMRARGETLARRTAVRRARAPTSGCAPSTTPPAARACPRVRCIRSSWSSRPGAWCRPSRSSTCTTCR